MGKNGTWVIAKKGSFRPQRALRDYTTSVLAVEEMKTAQLKAKEMRDQELKNLVQAGRSKNMKIQAKKLAARSALTMGNWNAAQGNFHTSQGNLRLTDTAQDSTGRDVLGEASLDMGETDAEKARRLRKRKYTFQLLRSDFDLRKDSFGEEVERGPRNGSFALHGGFEGNAPGPLGGIAAPLSAPELSENGGLAKGPLETLASRPAPLNATNATRTRSRKVRGIPTEGRATLGGTPENSSVYGGGATGGPAEDPSRVPVLSVSADAPSTATSLRTSPGLESDSVARKNDASSSLQPLLTMGKVQFAKKTFGRGDRNRTYARIVTNISVVQPHVPDRSEQLRRSEDIGGSEPSGHPPPEGTAEAKFNNSLGYPSEAAVKEGTASADGVESVDVFEEEDKKVVQEVSVSAYDAELLEISSTERDTPEGGVLDPEESTSDDSAESSEVSSEGEDKEEEEGSVSAEEGEESPEFPKEEDKNGDMVERGSTSDDIAESSQETQHQIVEEEPRSTVFSSGGIKEAGDVATERETSEDGAVLPAVTVQQRAQQSSGALATEEEEEGELEVVPRVDAKSTVLRFSSASSESAPTRSSALKSQKQESTHRLSQGATAISSTDEGNIADRHLGGASTSTSKPQVASANGMFTYNAKGNHQEQNTVGSGAKWKLAPQTSTDHIRFSFHRKHRKDISQTRTQAYEYIMKK
ncbi:hypothetical protein CYMTET_7578 [Cymbomonas tetramitiformis]|uniref:Uncharacterized protein n=1 Tax=Cymbomonas tetramitiformis TaxID=36881 RepID=A0AAE0GUV7_9CHLO|nr:hypothetical protein CYMTET_7578 [Cymbomonas tetramitiformis]